MQNTICKCDVCGAEKGDANGWFAARVNAWFIIVPFEEAYAQRTFEEHQHICGQECLHKRLSQWLEINSRAASAF